jgi:DNA-binding response OmpR family regulator
MIVEDDADIAMLVANVLAEEGYATDVVTDSRQALEVFSRTNPDLVTLDVMMPSLDGISLCLELRRNSDVPILFLSARKDPPDRVVGLRIGADDYMAKPFDTEELVARVDALLRRAGMSSSTSAACRRLPATSRYSSRRRSSSSCARWPRNRVGSSRATICSPVCGAMSPAQTRDSSTCTSVGSARSLRTRR